MFSLSTILKTILVWIAITAGLVVMAISPFTIFVLGFGGAILTTVVFVTLTLLTWFDENERQRRVKKCQMKS